MRYTSLLKNFVVVLLLVCAACAKSDDAVGDVDGNLGMGASACERDTEQELCRAMCERFCQNQVLHCLSSECDRDACAEGGDIVRRCLDESGDVGDARALCQAQLEATCGTFGLERNGEFFTSCLDDDPECVQNAELGCSNTCGTDDRVGGQLAGNGVCEDGHTEDSMSSECDRGTDCEDCGPHACAAPLEDCSHHADCCGFYGSGALCVAAREGSQTFCVEVCDDEHPCPEGFECIETSTDVAVCMAEDVATET